MLAVFVLYCLLVFLSCFTMVMMTDRSLPCLPDILRPSSVCHATQVSYMFLGEHTHNEARRMIDERAKNGTTMGSGAFSLSHFYPVMPRKYIIPPRAPHARNRNSDYNQPQNSHSNSDRSGGSSGVSGSTDSTTHNSSSTADDAVDEADEGPSTHRPFFVLQGNFGGKHAHRRDPKGALNCLRGIEDKWRVGGASPAQSWFTTSATATATATAATLVAGAGTGTGTGTPGKLLNSTKTAKSSNSNSSNNSSNNSSKNSSNSSSSKGSINTISSNSSRNSGRTSSHATVAGGWPSPTANATASAAAAGGGKRHVRRGGRRLAVYPSGPFRYPSSPYNPHLQIHVSQPLSVS